MIRAVVALIAISVSVTAVAPQAHAEGDVFYMGCSVPVANEPGQVLYGGCLLPGASLSSTGSAGLYSCDGVVVAVSATGSSCAAPSGWVRISDLYPFVETGGGWIAIPGVGNVYLPSSTAYLPRPLIVGFSGVAVSGTGDATSDWIAISGTGDANGSVRVEGTDTAFYANGFPPCENDDHWGDRHTDELGIEWTCLYFDFAGGYYGWGIVV